MSIIFAKEVREKAVSETAIISVDFYPTLDSGDTLTGTPTIVEVTTNALTLGSKVVNSGSVVVNNVTRGAGLVVQFTASGGSANNTYKIKITCSTTNGATKVRGIKLKVLPDPA